MNNRASQRPPRAYIATQEELHGLQESEDVKMEKKSQHGKLFRYSNQSVLPLPREDQTETGRQSAIFRFGKSLAASFNPSNWKIWPRTHDDEVSDSKISADDRARLERAYNEVKKIAPTAGSRPGGIGNIRTLNSTQLYDSALDSGGINAFYVSSSAYQREKRYGRVFINPPSIDGSGHREDSISQYSTQSASPFKQPPIRNLQVSHSNGSRSSLTHGNVGSTHILKHIPSRKDLQVQQKLVKRVSDLEMKLETARLELAKALSTSVLSKPMRSGNRRFVSGTLASLPSESLLSSYVSQSKPSPAISSHIGTAITTDERINPVTRQNHLETPGSRDIFSCGKSSVLQPPPKSNKVVPVPPDEIFVISKFEATGPANLDTRDEAENEDIGMSLTPDEKGATTPYSKKRKNIGQSSAYDGGLYKPSHESDDTSEPVRRTPIKKSRGNPRKQPKIEVTAGSENVNSAFAKSDSKKQAATKHQEHPKLTLKKCTLSDGQASRIHRKDSRKETPPSSAYPDGSITSPAANDAASRATYHDIRDEWLPTASPITPGAPDAPVKRQKAVNLPTPMVKSLSRGMDEQARFKVLHESKGKVEGGFEWGPDVF